MPATPGWLRARLASTATISACGCGLRTKAACDHAGEPDVVDVARAPGQEAPIFAADDAPADVLGRAEAHRAASSRITAAAARIARTMWT